MDRFKVVEMGIQKLDLKRGDILVLKLHEPIVADRRRDLEHALKNVLPGGVGFMVLFPGMELEVVQGSAALAAHEQILSG